MTFCDAASNICWPLVKDDYERLLALDDNTARRGMSAAALQRIPTSKWGCGGGGGGGGGVLGAGGVIGVGDSQEDGGSGDGSGGAGGSGGDVKCSVCLEEYAKGDTVRHLPCLHTYHMAGRALTTTTRPLWNTYTMIKHSDDTGPPASLG